MTAWTGLLRAIAIALALFVVACQSAVVPAPEKIPAWTTQLRDAQPADAFAAVYARRGQRLIVVGAAHANRTDSLTFRLINEAYESFPVNAVIVEGSPYSR